MKNKKTKSKESKPQLKVSSTGQSERVNRMDSKTHNRSSVNNKVVEEQKSYETKLPQDNENLPKPNISIKIDNHILKDKSQSQPPLKSQNGLNLVKGTFEDGQKLINILKNHTAQINLSLSPRRDSKSSQKKSPEFLRMQPETPNSQFYKKDEKLSAIKETIETNKFFTRDNSNQPRAVKIENEKSDCSLGSIQFATNKFSSQPELSIENTMSNISNKNPDSNKQRQLLEFIKTVKEKFAELENELTNTKNELNYYKRKSQEQEEVINELRRKDSYTTLKYGMLINQNHEMSIKLNKKSEIITHLKSVISQGLNQKKETQRSSSNYQMEENSFDSNFRCKSDNRERGRPQNALRTSSSAEIFSNTTGPSGVGRLFN